MKKYILIAGILIHFLPGLCQHRIGDFLAYSHNNGLPASLYYSVYQSSDGYLWIGSSSGLVRFDGKRYDVLFSEYADTNTISDNVIVDLVEDDAQNLWLAGFYQGLSKYNLKTGEIKRYSRLSQDDTPGYGINKLLKDHDGEIWVATAGRGLAHYLHARDSFEFFIPDSLQPYDGSVKNGNFISDIAVDPRDENIFWLPCFDGLYSFHKITGKFVRYMFPNPRLNGYPMTFLAVAIDDSDKIWLGTWNSGLMSFDKTTHKFASYTNAVSLQHKNDYQVLDVQSVNDSILYLASRNEGLLSFNKNTNAIIPLLTTEMLPDGSSAIDIQRISMTPDAGIFIGGNYYLYQQHDAYIRFDHRIQLGSPTTFGMNDMVYDDQRSGYWISFMDENEMLFLDKNKSLGKVYTLDYKNNPFCVDVAIDQNQDVWAVGYSSGLLKLDEDQSIFKRVTHVFPELDEIASQIQCIEHDLEGNLWLLTRQNLFYWKVKENFLQKINLIQVEEQSLDQLTLCAGQEQDVWIGSDRGLFHYHALTDKLYHLTPDEKTKSGIANLFIKAMTIDRAGNAWLGFESDGIQVVSVSDHTIVSVYNLKHGLPGMQINSMATDTAGKIWVGTSAGLALFDPDSDAGVWQLFNREDGIERDYIDRPIVATEDGRLFFNVEGGVSWVDVTDDPAISMRVPSMHITYVDVDGQAYNKEGLPDFLQTIELSYASKELQIGYAAMDWPHPFRTKYFYRLEGVTQSKEWIENPQATISLTDMKPGAYKLRLYAVSGDGVRSKERELAIVIHPPFWQRWWFFMVLVCCAIGLGYVIYRYRLGQLQKMQAMRNIISSNLHDDIGASLSNIHILTVLTQRNLANTTNATTYITKAGDEIQRISESLSDIVWNINPKYDDLDKLFFRMRRYAADMLEGKNIKSELVFPDMLEKIYMPMDQRRDFYLIFKEAINNLVRHSMATEASVRVMVDHRLIRMEIKDNGKGFDQHALPAGNGIQSIHQRAKKWKAVLDIQSGLGSGTNILLEMKIN